MKKHKFLAFTIAIAIIYFAIVRPIYFADQAEKQIEEISYSELINLIEDDQLEEIEVEPSSSENRGTVKATGNNQKIYSTYIPNMEIFIEYIHSGIKDNSALTVSVINKSSNDFLLMIFSILVSLIPIFLLFGFAFLKQFKNGTPSLLGLGDNSSHIDVLNNCNTKFADVAGLDEEKSELTEIVDFMKNPKKYLKLGAKIPKGALLSGPPGTGKTLLAKAVAGEAGVSFISVAGSHFVEMYVGLGASRVRELFKEARKNTPCIIFIDEIDAIGSKRSSSNSGGHSEHDQTLEQLLFELDGFKDRSDVILLAATNRPDSLDAALTRPGRFDRKIDIGLPDIAARMQILKIHAKDKPLFEDVDFKKLAYNTAGCSGAELANLLNESALIAARKNMDVINNECVDEAFRKIKVGLQKHRIITDKEKRLTAVHELGHALTSLFSKTQTDIKEISIIPTTRGAGGYTMNNAKEDQMYRTRTELFERIVVLLGGRAAEEYVLKEISTGAANDLKVATRIAGEMVSIYGMDKDIGPISIADTEYTERSILGEATYNKVGEKVLDLIKEAEKEAKQIIHVNIDLLNHFTKILLEKEVLSEAEIKNIFEEYNKENQ